MVRPTCALTETQVQRSVGSKDKMETNKRRDRQTDAAYCFTFPANAVSRYYSTRSDCKTWYWYQTAGTKEATPIPWHHECLVVDKKRIRPDHWLGLVFRVPFSAVGW